MERQQTPRHQSAWRVVLQVVAVGGLFVVAVWLGGVAEESSLVREAVSQFGYVGILIVSVASGFNLAFPVPVVAFLPLFLGSGFNFWTTLVVVTLGMTLGDSLGFLVGAAGRRVVEAGRRNDERILAWFEMAHKKFPRGAYVLLFLYAAFVPAPNELIVIPMSFAGYRFRFMIPIVLVGNFLFNTLSALGILGAVRLF
ncbi:hypothetical protein L0Y40_00250 [Candidatus Wolfebacteria bacterium]|nr:hypothetical protein [Candidatus Wolfebacteria bacterium]